MATELTGLVETSSARSTHWIRLSSFALIALGIPGAVVGFALGDSLALTTSAACLGAGFLARDISRPKRGPTPMTLYAFSGTVTAIANTIAVLNQDTSRRPVFFLYAVDEYLPIAVKIEWLGLVLPILAFNWLVHRPKDSTPMALAPNIRGTIPSERIIQLAVAAAVVGIVARITRVLPPLGTLNSLIYFLPHLAAFSLARIGVMRSWQIAVWLGFAIAITESSRALLFAYLRTDVISPIAAYAFGVVAGARSLKAFRTLHMVPVYAFGALAITYFAAFGQVRQRSGPGISRLEAVAEVRERQLQQEELPRHNLITRMSSINQLTQLVRVSREDGLYHGGTLEYLAYAWIPRFLWPEKPTIAKGAWFALRIGQARIANGSITNAVNMTVPGELYLNYSWYGVIIGMLAFGAFFAVLWMAGGAMQQADNILGAAFCYYLLWVGLGGGADLQIVVTLLAMYLVFLGASVVFPKPKLAEQAPNLSREIRANALS